MDNNIFGGDFTSQKVDSPNRWEFRFLAHEKMQYLIYAVQGISEEVIYGIYFKVCGFIFD